MNLNSSDTTHEFKVKTEPFQSSNIFRVNDEGKQINKNIKETINFSSYETPIMQYKDHLENISNILQIRKIFLGGLTPTITESKLNI